MTRRVSPAILGLLALGLLWGACGGGDDEGAATPVRAPRPAAAEPAAAPLALNRLFPAALDGRPLVSAGAGVVAESFAGLESAAGVPITPAEVAERVGLQELFEAVYRDDTRADPEIVAIEITRLATPAGALDLLALIRDDPLDAGVRRAAPGSFAPDRAYALVKDLSADPAAGPFAAALTAQAAAVIVIDGDLAVRVEVGAASGERALATATAVAEGQLRRIQDARAGTLLAPLERPFARLGVAALVSVLPSPPAGFTGPPAERGPGGVSGRYFSDAGALIVYNILLAEDAIHVFLLDAVLGGPDAVQSALATSGAPISVLDSEPWPMDLPADRPLGQRLTSARLTVVVEGALFVDEIVAFRQGSAWIIVQGLAPVLGLTPVVEVARGLAEAVTRAGGGGATP